MVSNRIEVVDSHAVLGEVGPAVHVSEVESSAVVESREVVTRYEDVSTALDVSTPFNQPSCIHGVLHSVPEESSDVSSIVDLGEEVAHDSDEVVFIAPDQLQYHCRF